MQQSTACLQRTTSLRVGGRAARRSCLPGLRRGGGRRAGATVLSCLAWRFELAFNGESGAMITPGVILYTSVGLTADCRVETGKSRCRKTTTRLRDRSGAKCTTLNTVVLATHRAPVERYEPPAADRSTCAAAHAVCPCSGHPGRGPAGRHSSSVKLHTRPTTTCRARRPACPPEGRWRGSGVMGRVGKVRAAPEFQAKKIKLISLPATVKFGTSARA